MKYFFLALSITLFAACGGNEMSSDAELQQLEASRVAQEAAYESMVEAHDRIMPMMGQVTAAQRAIREQLDADDLGDDREDLLEAAYEQLEDTNDGMMEWMQNMKPLDDLRATMDNDEITRHIERETSNIAGVETRIKTAVAQAKELVGDHSGHSHSHGDGHDHSH